MPAYRMAYSHTHTPNKLKSTSYEWSWKAGAMLLIELRDKKRSSARSFFTFINSSNTNWLLCSSISLMSCWVNCNKPHKIEITQTYCFWFSIVMWSKELKRNSLNIWLLLIIQDNFLCDHSALFIYERIYDNYKSDQRKKNRHSLRLTFLK